MHEAQSVVPSQNVWLHEFVQEPADGGAGTGVGVGAPGVGGGAAHSLPQHCAGMSIVEVSE